MNVNSVPVARGRYNYVRGKNNFDAWIESSALTLELTVRGGIIYDGYGDIRVSLYKIDSTQEPLSPEKLVDEIEVANLQGTTHPIRLQASEGGLHRIVLRDRTAGAKLSWDGDVRITVSTDPSEHTNFYAGKVMYFYVPTGTPRLGFYARNNGHSGDGRVYAGETEVFDFSGKQEDYFSIDVPEGQDGKIWRLENGYFELLTVPAQIALHPDELLLPAAVVNSDQLQ